jgi:integrase
MEQAIDARLRRDNPCHRVKIPRRPAHADRVLLPDEDELLLGALDRQFPGRPDARLFVELMLYGGLRWEEVGALDREHVDLRRAVVHIGPVLERDGNIRPYPKSPAGKRTVPIDDQVWPRLRAHSMTVRGLLFTRAGGKTLDYSSWHHAVWRRGLLEVTERQGRRILAERQTLEDPQPTPHDLRHTYGTRLADTGMPVHDIMKLMGHENLSSAQRYLHAGEGRFDRAREAMKQARGL